MIKSLLIASSYLSCLGALSCKQNPSTSQTMSAEEAKGINAELNKNMDEVIASYGQEINSSEYQNTIAMAQSEQEIPSNAEDIATIESDDPLALKSKSDKNIFADQKPKASLRLLDQTNMIKNLWSKVDSAWNQAGKNACRILEPQIRAGGVMATRPYLFVGGNVDAGVTFHASLGRDLVWDLYNMQFASFTYQAASVVFGSGQAGAGVNGYMGLGFGLRNDVSAAWSGYFLSAGASGSLPFLSNYLSAAFAGFVAADNNRKQDLSFAGGSIGASLAFSFPMPMPGAINTSTGYWKIDKAFTAMIAKRWSGVGLANSMFGNNTCNGDCVRFDTKRSPATYRERARTLAASIPLIVVQPGAEYFLPGFDKIVLLALATGVMRDTLNAQQACLKN